MADAMRVIELRVENFKRLRAVQVQPDAHVVTVTGANGQGKTSLLDAVWFALVGRAGSGQQLVRQGESRAVVQVNLGDLIVTRTWTQKSGTGNLTVTSADGTKYPTPQSVLDQLIGQLTFDPLAFASADEKQQLSMLLSVVKLPFDPNDIARQRQLAYDERTVVNREVKRFQVALDSLPPAPAGAPDDEIPVSQIGEEYAQLSQKLQRYQQLQQRYADLQRELQAVYAEGVALKNELPANPEEHIAQLGEQLRTADAVNLAVRQKRERSRILEERTRVSAAADALTKRIEELDRTKRDGIRSAEMPVSGLSFDENGVLFNGVPFKQASQAERLRTSVAIAMAMNPNIRIIRITDGSLLDSHNMEIIRGLAATNDFQVWIERVDETGTYGIIIEDGTVKAHGPDQLSPMA